MFRSITGTAYAAGFVLLLIVQPGCGHRGDDLSGRWSATIQVGQTPVPFRLDLETQGATAKGYLFDGENRLPSSDGTYQDNKLHLHFDLYNGDLNAALEGGELHGTYLRHYGKKDVPRAFQAVRYTAPPAATATGPSVAGDWQLTSADPKVKNDWKMTLQQNGADVSGSILRLDGDTGALTGTMRDGKLSISHFSGARPTLVEGTLEPDGTLALLVDRDTKLTGVRSADAKAPDAFHATSMKNPAEPFRWTGTDATGTTHSSTDDQFRGKVMAVSIGGTWCPNCMDEAPFLVDLYRKYHAQGLEIVGLNFESGNDPYDRKRVQAFLAKYAVPYLVVIAGTTDNADSKLNQLANFGAYPTTVFVGRDGLVHAIHDGFASVATGAEHTKLKAETDRIVESLLAQKAG